MVKCTRNLIVVLLASAAQAQQEFSVAQNLQHNLERAAYDEHAEASNWHNNLSDEIERAPSKVQY